MQDIKIDTLNLREAAKVAETSEKKKKETPQRPDGWIIAWLCMLECMQTATDTTNTLAKQIQNSTTVQNQLLQEQSQIYLQTLNNTKVNSAQLTQLETQNELAQAQRGVIGQQMSGEQQNVSITSSLLSTQLNSINQTQSEMGYIPQMELNIANRVAQI